MPIRPNAFADDHRIRALSVTLELTAEQVNTAFAAYVPRDTVEAAMVEQILLLRHNLHHATRAAQIPGLPPALADRLRRTVCALMQHLDRVSDRLEKRQWQAASGLPQQYWREEPIGPVGPYVGPYDGGYATAGEADQAAATPPVINPAPPKPVPSTLEPPKLEREKKLPAAAIPAEPVRRFGFDDPRAEGDALHQLLRMKIPENASTGQIWAAAQRDAARSGGNRAERRAQSRGGPPRALALCPPPV